ncbi:hypothetical protein AMAG_15373 [Allomyces macrogynus ATCC 38327]|uniref:Zinc finger PHD-type domain-containing protein n=1 Tax=Allomyces macrogynus (strain ATCC 38327) TaxID=578462 RepID=A0A0L0T7E4_ALLM3|nr:hypothetical protein AMAG_15373 [Allomyces macrogynus ATCC 38327]|eukprot:KNE70616.1 hypothetical protein AMAG_15373 [Allomyces macrogynus ATCC 38327]
MTSPGPIPTGMPHSPPPPPHVLAHPLLGSSAADRTPPPPPPPLPLGPMAIVPPPHAWFPNIFGDSARNGMLLPSPIATWFGGSGAPSSSGRAGSTPPPSGPISPTEMAAAAAAATWPVSPTSVAAAAAEGVNEAVDAWKRHQPHICCVCLHDRAAAAVDAPLWVCANPACDVAVHRECASIVPGQVPPRMAESTHAPPGWRCDRCQSLESTHVVCTYCPLRIGAFTQLPGGPRGRGPWAHIVCARWHYRASASPVSGRAATKSPALVRAGSTRASATVGNSNSGASGPSGSLPAEALYGALLKCADRTCTHHFHAACAHSEGLLPVAIANDEFGGARCREHASNASAWPIAYAASNAWVQWVRLRHQFEALAPTNADLVAASVSSVPSASSFVFWPSDDEDEDDEEHGSHHHQQHLPQHHQHGPGSSHHHHHHDHPALHHGTAPLQLPSALDVDDHSAILPSPPSSSSSLHLFASPEVLPSSRSAGYLPTTTATTSASASVTSTRPASPTLTDIEAQVIHVFRTLQASERSPRVIDQLGLELAVQLSEWVDARTATSGRASPPRESCPRDPAWLLSQLTPLLHRRRAVPRLVCGVPATPPVDRKRPAPDSSPLMGRASKRISPTPANGEMMMMGDAYALAAETDPTSAAVAHATAAATAAAAAAVAAAIMEFVPITEPLFLNHAQNVADLDALAARHEGYEPKPAPASGSKSGVKRKNNNNSSNAASAAGDASPPTDSSSSSSSSATPAARPAGLTFQELRFPNDLYTPNWTRGVGHGKEGLCRLCPPESGEAWFKIKVSAYWYHLNYHHGVSQTSGRPFDAPVQERFDSTARIREGLCHKCHTWIPLDSPRHTPVNVPQIYWWKHAQKCHFRDPRGSGSGNRNGDGAARAAALPAMGGFVSSVPATRRRTAAASSARIAPASAVAIAAAPATAVQLPRSLPPVAAPAPFGGSTARRRPRFDDEDDDEDDADEDDDEYVD